MSDQVERAFAVEDSLFLLRNLATVSRIQDLYEVHISISYSPSNQDQLVNKTSVWATVRIQGKTTENCIKAQDYIESLCRPESLADVSCSAQLVRPLFEEYPNTLRRDAIERDFGIVLKSNSRGIRVQGKQSSVRSCLVKLQELLEAMSRDMGVGGTGPSVHPHVQSRDGHSTTPPNLAQKLVQFESLGYPKQAVESVLCSLGGGASDNDIIARLMKVTSHTQASVSNPPTTNQPGLRPIVVDGSNVAMRHGNGQVFSCKGIHIVVDWFLRRGHKKITVFVPQWRKESSKPESPIMDQDVLLRLEKEGFINFTPSRHIGNKRIVCYDDRFIVKLAATNGGVIVSNDNFRDLIDEEKSWREAIEKRLLMFTFVEDTFMPPSDPLGRYGPHLDDFLRFEGGKAPMKDHPTDRQAPSDKQPCPYAERCTFGPKCRFYHPEREQRLREKERESERVTRTRSPPSVMSCLQDRGGGDVTVGNSTDSDLSAHVQQLTLSPQRVPQLSRSLTKANSSNCISDYDYSQVRHQTGRSLDSLTHEPNHSSHPNTFPIFRPPVNHVSVNQTKDDRHLSAPTRSVSDHLLPHQDGTYQHYPLQYYKYPPPIPSSSSTSSSSSSSPSSHPIYQHPLPHSNHYSPTHPHSHPHPHPHPLSHPHHHHHHHPHHNHVRPEVMHNVPQPKTYSQHGHHYPPSSSHPSKLEQTRMAMPHFSHIDPHRSPLMATTSRPQSHIQPSDYYQSYINGAN